MTVSWQLRVVAAYLRGRQKPRTATAELVRRRIAEPKGEAGPPGWLGRLCRVEKRSVNGADCWTVGPRDGREPVGAVVYWHGGSYYKEMVRWHWAFVGQLAASGFQVHVPRYGLAPRHTFREAVALGRAVHREVAARAKGLPVTAIGDSAGGGLALAVAMSLRDSGLPGPRGWCCWRPGWTSR
ncbi:hypothetical protein KCH_64370 [Kitasatospora cheerisanensis KCTC 2395]|uniref:Alpha/beta hydrolase fold-3 domain-containing protein n=1 Tax=Kitasatospora cheerisanensis KCTC 2395 TaxID=1348663 RepID=A0A066YKR1_9ACTN|nr:hypothetical protein KCH_64370 [Kitasatospora cheerisanensis KCTC 2395]